MQETIRAAKPLFTGPEWNFDLLRDTYDAIAEIGLGEMGLDIYRNQIEVITASASAGFSTRFVRYSSIVRRWPISRGRK
jgi:spore cortex formation protein SpoVR/YcgB (stage V sporulation)